MRNLRRTLLTSAAGVLLTAGSTPAFYFNGWPGSGEPIRRSLVPSDKEDLPGNPPGTPIPNGPGNDSRPPVVTTPHTPGEQPSPENVPEPATALLGLFGLSVAVAARLRRGRGPAAEEVRV